MAEITARAVQQALRECLFADGEDRNAAILVEGVVNKFGFHPTRLEARRELVSGWLAQLPRQFSGGWSFLQACVTETGEQWGQHIDIEALLVLGQALGLVELCAPRSMWPLLPGGMPYYKIPNAGRDDVREVARG